MKEPSALKGAVVKVLAIVGFFVTVALLVWLAFEGGRRAPGAFASLAAIVESLENRGAVEELSIATEKTVVNSGESFKISWTDMRADGEYTFSYSCTEGVDLEVRGEDDKLVKIPCTSELTLPGTVYGLFLTLSSDEMRFIDVPIAVTFDNVTTGRSYSSDAKVTVVNATIPIVETEVAVRTSEPEFPVVAVPKAEPKTSEATKPVAPAPKPVYTTVYPTPNPNGYVDLHTTTVGVGTLVNGVFTYAGTYDRTKENAIRFDIANIGSKTSGPWTFTTILPSGETYTSDVQEGLKPMEHVEFTLGFRIYDDKATVVKIVNTAYTTGDVNAANDSSTWLVVVGK